MAKSNIQNISTTQTFQNWLDKTNEMVDLYRTSTVTASALGDVTTGDALINGEMRANTIVADTNMLVDNIASFTSANTIQFTSPIQITGATTKTVATFNYQSGGQTRYTDGTISWQTGINNSADGDFIIDTGIGEPKLKVTPEGTIESYNIILTEDITARNINALSGNITANTFTANTITITDKVTGDVTGDLTGDVFAANGTTKILENGDGTSANVARFTGNVLGTVSSLTNHNTDALAERPTSPTNKWFTDTRARNAVSGGANIIYDAETGVFNLPQAVGTNSYVTFGQLDVGANGITSSGDITAFGTISDMTMKENINPIENALDKVSQLGGYTFNYLSNPDTPMTGVMAQEIQKVLPGIVYETKDPVTGKETYAVRHGNIVGLLIEAIKELSAKLDK